jgi:hypothetical protein
VGNGVRFTQAPGVRDDTPSRRSRRRRGAGRPRVQGGMGSRTPIPPTVFPVTVRSTESMAQERILEVTDPPVALPAPPVLPATPPEAPAEPGAVVRSVPQARIIPPPLADSQPKLLQTAPIRPVPTRPVPTRPVPVAPPLAAVVPSLASIRRIPTQGAPDRHRSFVPAPIGPPLRTRRKLGTLTFGFAVFVPLLAMIGLVCALGMTWLQGTAVERPTAGVSPAQLPTGQAPAGVPAVQVPAAVGAPVGSASVAAPIQQASAAGHAVVAAPPAASGGGTHGPVPVYHVHTANGDVWLDENGVPCRPSSGSSTTWTTVYLSLSVAIA